MEPAFEVIDTLQKLGAGGVTEIGAEAGLAKSTFHKHLNTLAVYDYVVKEEDEYRFGFRLLDIGGHVRSRFPRSDIIKTNVEELAAENGEITLYMTEECGRAIVLYRETDRDGVPTRTRAGKRMYLHQLASGKAILASVSRELIEETIDRHGLQQAMDATITDRDELLAELDEIRDSGIADSYGETAKGLHAVTVLLSDADGSVLGAAVVSGLSTEYRGIRWSRRSPTSC